MISDRDGHIRVLPVHVANKIAAGEVVERPASVVKELVENSIDAGAKRIAITITQGGRKLVAVRDDGCGMTRDDAILSLERQATSKIRDVTDIEAIDTLGFRGEAVPSIASVSRFSITTRRHDSDEGTFILVNAGTIAEISSAGCPAGTLVEVRDLFCNVPARRKFLRACATEENHVRQIFTVHALAHPDIGFSLTVDGRELSRLAPSASAADRVRELFGDEFVHNLLTIHPDPALPVRVSGFIEKPNLSTPTRRDQYVFVNGRPATAPSIAAALRDAWPRRAGDARPAAIINIDLPATQVDVNVHPTKREVRFRDNSAVRNAVIAAISAALTGGTTSRGNKVPRSGIEEPTSRGNDEAKIVGEEPRSRGNEATTRATGETRETRGLSSPSPLASHVPTLPAPLPVEFAIEPDSPRSRPWQWFKFLAQSGSGYLLVETDSGIVTINPHAARERIIYERLIRSEQAPVSQTLLVPEIVRLTPVEAARIKASLAVLAEMGFQIEEFGADTFKIDAVPQDVQSLSLSGILSTIARDLSESGSKRGGERWREELVAKSIARSSAGASMTMTASDATRLVEELCSCRMPYICPRGKPVMIFTSTRELNRKFNRE